MLCPEKKLMSARYVGILLHCGNVRNWRFPDSTVKWRCCQGDILLLLFQGDGCDDGFQQRCFLGFIQGQIGVVIQA